MPGLDIDKALKEAVIKQAQEEHRKNIEGGFILDDSAIGVTASANVGNGWGIAGYWKRFRATGKSEANVGFKKEF